MGHGKLRKFAENETFRCLLQPDASSVLAGTGRQLVLRDHPIKGRWNSQMFAKEQPIVLELGCGKGDYTIALAQRHPEINYIGVDIKGARLWTGAKYATEHALPNVAFLRTRVEFIEAFFDGGEVSEIWLTFSDPQLSGSENSRLSSPMFLERYRKFMAPDGIVHLKTDSRFLHEYTMAVVRANGLEVLACGTDIYKEGIVYEKEAASGVGQNFFDHFPGEKVLVREGKAASLYDIASVTEVQTFYEKMFLQMGLPITYLAFRITHSGPFVAPADFDSAFWRAAEGPRRSFGHQ